MKKIIVFLMLLVPMTCSADWVKTTAQVLLQVDYVQTLVISDHNRIERNPIIGLNPSRERVTEYFTIATVAVKETPRWVDLAVIAVQMVTVVHNYKLQHIQDGIKYYPAFCWSWSF